MRSIHRLGAPVAICGLFLAAFLLGITPPGVAAQGPVPSPAVGAPGLATPLVPPPAAATPLIPPVVATLAAPSKPEPSATGSDAPTAAPYSTLDGVWEVQLQKADHTTYSTLKIRQNADGVSGMWIVNGGEQPINGSYDGRQFRFVTKDASGDVTLAGYVENATVMVGLLESGGTSTPFTASHRGGLNGKPAQPNYSDKRGHKPGY